MRKLALVACLGMLVALASPAWAHFGMIIPNTNIIEGGDSRTVQLTFMFWHPMENKGMDLAKPAQVGVMVNGKKLDLTSKLIPAKLAGHQIWKLSYRIRRPGDYIFFMAPKPYWEPAEKLHIVHYTKTVVSALGAEEGWDKPVGLPMEIVPLTKPYGLWAGMSFTGRVLFKGRPLAGATVEVEFYNPTGKLHPPKDAYITQVVTTDPNGVFTVALPWGGWWGFSALTEVEGGKKELGGVLWIYAHPKPRK